MNHTEITQSPAEKQNGGLDLIVQFSRLWGQLECDISYTSAKNSLSSELRAYDSIEVCELVTKWANEYLSPECDIEDSVDFFNEKIHELTGLEV